MLRIDKVDCYMRTVIRCLSRWTVGGADANAAQDLLEDEYCGSFRHE